MAVIRAGSLTPSACTRLRNKDFAHNEPLVVSVSAWTPISSSNTKHKAILTDDTNTRLPCVFNVPLHNAPNSQPSMVKLTAYSWKTVKTADQNDKEILIVDKAEIVQSSSSSTIADEALVRALEPLTFTKILAEIVQHKKKETPSAPPPAKKQRTDGGAASTSDADVVVTGVVDADEAAAAKKKAAEARGDVVDLVMTEDMENRSREATEKACNYLRYCEPMVPGGGADETHGQRAIDVNQLDAILKYVALAHINLPEDVAHILKLADKLTPDVMIPASAVRELLPPPSAATTSAVVVKTEGDKKHGKGKEGNAKAPATSEALCPAYYDDSSGVGGMDASMRVALRAIACHCALSRPRVEAEGKKLANNEGAGAGAGASANAKADVCTDLGTVVLTSHGKNVFASVICDPVKYNVKGPKNKFLIHYFGEEKYPWGFHVKSEMTPWDEERYVSQPKSKQMTEEMQKAALESLKAFQDTGKLPMDAAIEAFEAEQAKLFLSTV
ncbi:hypothetical protein RI054_07g36420 [Pseudoscourfieldia marina]